MAHGTSVQRQAYIVKNRLPESDSLFTTNTGSWSVTAGSATVSVDFQNKPFVFGQHNALKISPSNSSDVTITVDQIQTEQTDAKDYMSFHCFALSSVNVATTIEISRNSTAATSNLVSIRGGKWGIIRATPAELPYSTIPYQIQTSITFSNHNGNPIYLFYPVIYAEYQLRRNIFVEATIPLIPEVFKRVDSQQSYPTYPMFRMLDVGLTWAGYAFALQEHFIYRDNETGYDENNDNTKSGLVNPDVVDDRYIPWLASITGTKLIGEEASTTPWANLPTIWSAWMSEIDPADNASFLLTSIQRTSDVVTATAVSALPAWVIAGALVSVDDGSVYNGSSGFQGIFEIVSVNGGLNQFTYNDPGADATINPTADFRARLVDTEWTEIERYDISASGLEDYWRFQIKTGYNGQNAGTTTAIEESVKWVLSGTKTVQITKHHTGDPWKIQIQTLEAETPNGAAEPTDNPVVLRAISLAKPLGYKVNHISV